MRTDRDIEDRLREFALPAPRPESRARVLEAVRTAGVSEKSIIASNSHDDASTTIGGDGAPPSSQEAKVVDVSGGRRAVGAGRNENCSAIAVPRRARTFRRPALLFVAAAAAAAAGIAILVTTPGRIQPDVPAGTVTQGELLVTRGHHDQTLRADDELRSTDRMLAVQTSDLRLADGSEVKLDHGTQLRLRPLQDGERANLELLDGRIFVRAATRPERFVISGAAQVEVKGTVFGVQRRAAATDVNVYEGRVAVCSADTTLLVTRGMSAMAADHGAPQVTTEDPNAALDWARDVVRFDDRPLGEVFDWIAANSTFRFVGPDAATRAKRVHVEMDHGPLRQTLESLMLACSLNYEIDGANEVKIRP